MSWLVLLFAVALTLAACAKPDTLVIKCTCECPARTDSVPGGDLAWADRIDPGSVVTLEALGLRAIGGDAGPFDGAVRAPNFSTLSGAWDQQ